MGTPGAGTPIGGIGTPVGGGVHTPATEFSSSCRGVSSASLFVASRPVGGIATPVGLGPSTIKPKRGHPFFTPLARIARGGIATPVGGIATPVGGIATGLQCMLHSACLDGL